MKERIYIFLLALCAVLLVPSCKKQEPSVRRQIPSVYHTAYEQIYGHCYDSIPYAVVALDLYSDSLFLDRHHRIKGTGYNLCLSDIFVPDSLLEEGTYRSIPSTEIPTPFTFLQGKDYEGYPHGMYILDIEDSKISRIQVLDSGSFIYRNDSLLFSLYYQNTQGTTTTYQCHFQGALIPWLKQ